jgi:hypothetical protein
MIVDRELLEWDLELPQRGVVDTLWQEQLARWPQARQVSVRQLELVPEH